MHPSETLSALVYSDGMDMHPVQSQSLQECSSSQVRSLAAITPSIIVIYRLSVHRLLFLLTSIPTTISWITATYAMYPFPTKKKANHIWVVKITRLRRYLNLEKNIPKTNTFFQLLTPHSGMEQSKNEMFCKLCGNRFMSMAPLVEHIRREHERDHPKSLAPLNLHTSHLLK